MPLAAILDVPAQIAAAIKKASQATGADFDYLLKTAARESGFRPEAKSEASSAAGPFQFIENTWLRMIKAEGHRFGFGHLADAIVQDERGHCRVSDAAARAEILKLRHDPEMSALMAGAFAQQNADIMADKLGRAPTEGELYIAHFLGAPRGTQFVQLAQAQPDQRADAHFAREARANRAIFYDKGEPRSLAQVYETLVSRHCGTPLEEAARGAGPVPALPGRSPLAVASAQPMRAPTKGFAPVKAAALTQKTLQVAPESATRAGADSGGGIGSWRTIVLPGPMGGPKARPESEPAIRLDAAKTRARATPKTVQPQAPRAPDPAAAAPSNAGVPTPSGSQPEPRLHIDSALYQVFGDDFRSRMS